MAGSDKKRPHVTISADVASPTHGFVEKFHTPGSSHSSQSGKSPAEMTVDEWDREKHAHVDADVASPHGLVNRRSTPTLQTGLGYGGGKHAHVEDIASPHGLVKRQLTPTCKGGLKCSFDDVAKADTSEETAAKRQGTLFTVGVAVAVLCAIVLRV